MLYCQRISTKAELTTKEATTPMPCHRLARQMSQDTFSPVFRRQGAGNRAPPPIETYRFFQGLRTPGYSGGEIPFDTPQGSDTLLDPMEVLRERSRFDAWQSTGSRGMSSGQVVAGVLMRGDCRPIQSPRSGEGTCTRCLLLFGC